MIEIPKKEPLNIVPFIDIMLVLLAMVLSISTFIAKGEIKISLPASEAGAKVTANDNSRLVQVDNAGVLYWDGKSVTAQELDEAVKNLSRQENVVLRIDKDSKFEHFITVIDVLRNTAMKTSELRQNTRQHKDKKRLTSSFFLTCFIYLPAFVFAWNSVPETTFKAAGQEQTVALSFAQMSGGGVSTPEAAAAESLPEPEPEVRTEPKPKEIVNPQPKPEPALKKRSKKGGEKAAYADEVAAQKASAEDCSEDGQTDRIESSAAKL